VAKGLFIKAGLAIAVIAICAGLWAGLPRLSDPLTVTIDEALAVQEPAGGYQGCGTWHSAPDCRSAAARGRDLALFVVLLAGIPLSITGFSLAMRARRRESGTPNRWRPVYYGATVFQAGNAAFTGILLVLLAWEGSVPRMILEDPASLIFLAGTLISSTLAIPAWHRVAGR
jgi:hypothetical protein